jgi:isocitrate dehydrogenase
VNKKQIVIASGDGIGPEIMQSTLAILKAASAPLEYTSIEVGGSVYAKGITSGVPREAWDLIRRYGCLLKGPITTPQGKGYKSVNVTIRKTFNLFANIRPSKSYNPFVASAHPGINLVIIRENEEDLYAGIEHRQTPEVTQVLKIISRPGCENIIRYAFEYARSYGRGKVTCMTKDNIMKLTDGLFHQVFDEIAVEYPEIRSDHQIIDIGAARLAAQPESFDVIVTLNLYGDILSDIASQLSGSVGFAASANIGRTVAMFEAVHGSAPDIAGKDIANPSGLLIAATQMLVHLGFGSTSETIKNAWLSTIEDGIHTNDIYREGLSQELVGTRRFTEEVSNRLGKKPRHLHAVEYHDHPINVVRMPARPTERRLVGVDTFLFWDDAERRPDVLAERLMRVLSPHFRLTIITNRGVKVYPDGIPETFCTDHWRCRLLAVDQPCTNASILGVLGRITNEGLDIIKTENLYTFDGQPGYSLGQGE